MNFMNPVVYHNYEWLGLCICSLDIRFQIGRVAGQLTRNMLRASWTKKSCKLTDNIG